ncbi:YdeI/OmpD-associated family protein [Nocardia yamanashiensis]|uniref:YdeI/OmpD-associated family protein n=1 Tax=Nocardia yamanashiensis TaxID=209247 RepID=UPI000835FDBC|nr:YdeI/OmpD-associated family protein [Nocardia yamanashiensis]
MSALERPVLFFPDERSFRDWLAANHAAVDGIWVKFAKDPGVESLGYDGAVRQALCFGWIDGQARRADDEFTLQGFTPRRRNSPWTTRNTAVAEELIAQGLMHPAGQAEIDQAKADGRWSNAEERDVPQDFLDELAKYPEAAAFFETLPPLSRYTVGYELSSAARPETRARRLERMIRNLIDGKPL